MSKPRYPEFKEKGKCRGCGSPVPKGRQTWCSTKCFEEHDPNTARRKVEQRDKGVCSQCGTDTKKLERRLPSAYGQPEVDNWHPRFSPNGISSPFDKERYDRAVSIRRKHFIRWKMAADKRKAAYAKAGYPTSKVSHFWEADHIVPHSEGGNYALENMRTLCVPCHKARTKAWHQERKQRKQYNQPALLSI